MSAQPSAFAASGAQGQGALKILVPAMAVLFGAVLLRAAYVAGFTIPINYNEGWNAYHAADAMAGRPPYPAAGMMFNNYPPLSFYVVGALGRILGDQILAGRILSLLSFAAVAPGMRAWMLRAGAAGGQASFAAQFFAGVVLVLANFVGVDDPQLLGQALGMCGVLLLVRRERTMPMLLGGGLLLTLAAFTKHSLVAQPLAVTAWLALHNRRDALRLAVAGLAFGAALLAAIDLMLHTNLLADLFSARSNNIGGAYVGTVEWQFTGLVPAAATILLLRERRGDPFAAFAAIYLVLAFIIGTAGMGAAGVDIDAMFDADIAAALGLGLFLRHAPPRLAAGFAWAAVAPLALGLLVRVGAAWLPPSHVENLRMRKILTRLEQAGDPRTASLVARNNIAFWPGRKSCDVRDAVALLLGKPASNRRRLQSQPGVQGGNAR